MTGQAKPYQPVTLKQYIKTTCPRNCVSDVLLITILKQESARVKVDYKDFLPVIRVESSFNRKATNGSNVGLSQVHLKYHRKKFKKKDYYDAVDNIRVGLSIFKACLVKSKGNKNKAYTCYNGGGNKKYVQKVTKAFKELAKLKGIDKMT